MPQPFLPLNLSEFHALVDRFEFDRKITAVHMHHTWKPTHADYSGQATIDAMHRFHTGELGWSDIAQHVSIGPDGVIWTGRNWNRPPASSSGRNGDRRAGPFMFETIGNFDDGKDPFGGVQKDAVLHVIAALLRRFGLGTDKLRFHRQLGSPKSCPGTSIDYDGFVDELRAFMADGGELDAGVAKGRRLFDPGGGDDDTTVQQQRVLKAVEALSAETRGIADEPDAELPCQHDSRWFGGGPGYSEAELELLRAHVINMNDGRLQPSGDFETSPEDVQRIFRELLPAARREAEGDGRPLRVLFFAHGGLNKEGKAIQQALAHIPVWVDSGVYPIFFVWETGFMKSLSDAIFGGAGERGLARGEIKDKFLEKVAFAPGNFVWGQMKDNARRSTDPDVGGGWLTAQELAGFLDGQGGDGVELYALGHSAGAILHSHFLPAALSAGVDAFEELYLLAPAIRVDAFKDRYLPHIGQGIRQCTMFTLDEETELDDTVGPYGKSLLYFISRSFEKDVPTPILGLEESVRADTKLRQLFVPSGSPAEVVWSPTPHTGGRRASSATRHGGFGNEPVTLNSIARRLLGDDSVEPFPADFAVGERDMDAFGTADLGGTAMPVVVAPAVGEAAPLSVRRRALCIGIDDYPDAPLNGCVNDAREWAATFRSLGFDTVDLMLEVQASRAAILNAIRERVEASAPGDVLAVQFAGHGTRVDDVNGDEVVDKLDEALVPHDYQGGNFLIDDDLRDVFDRIPEGVNVTLFMDCCHSATNSRTFGFNSPTALIPGQRIRFLPVDPGIMALHVKKREGAPPPASRGPMREVNFGACRPEQTAKEIDGHGYFTVTVTRLLREQPLRSHEELLKAVLAEFPLPPSSQEPRLDCAVEKLTHLLFGGSGSAGGGGAGETASAGGDKRGGGAGPDPAVIAETMRDYMRLMLRLT